MTELEAIDEVAHLKGLFPLMPTTQMAWWKERFVRYELPAVRRAIDLFAERYSEHVDRAGLLTLIDQQSAKKYIPRDPAAEKTEADAHWAEVESTLAALTDEQREKLRAVALSTIAEPARAFLAGKGERPSRMLAAVMFKRLQDARAKRASHTGASHV